MPSARSRSDRTPSSSSATRPRTTSPARSSGRPGSSSSPSRSPSPDIGAPDRHATRPERGPNMTHTDTETVQIRAHHRVVKNVGNWTTARRFDVRASHGVAVLDLLLPQLESGDVEVALDIDHATVKLLVPDGTVIDDDVRRVGRG